MIKLRYELHVLLLDLYGVERLKRHAPDAVLLASVLECGPRA